MAWPHKGSLKVRQDISPAPGFVTIEEFISTLFKQEPEDQEVKVTEPANGQVTGKVTGKVTITDVSEGARRTSVPDLSMLCSGNEDGNSSSLDDEDSDGTMKHMSYKDRRREAHTHAEQKRRDAIKKGYEELFNLLPANQQTDSLGSQKLSKAAVLQKSIEYMKHLTSQKKKQEDQLTALQKEVTALKIMKANYELIVQTHKNAPQQGQNQVSDEVKFQVFQHVMDMLFQSFNASISVATFAELSGCVFNWLEEHCKPQNLREFTMDILSQVSTQINNQQL